MYDPSDPRAALMAAPERKTTGPFNPAQAADFTVRQPDETAENHRAFFWRARNLIVMVVELDGTFHFARHGQQDEFVLLTLDPIETEIVSEGGSRSFGGKRLTILPPGDSEIIARGKGVLTLLFSPRNTDIAVRCGNQNAYEDADPRIPPFQPWPDPPGGFRLRSYDLNVPPEEGRFGRIFRCTTMMVNVLDPRMGLRDPSKVSPHHHDNFEQVSLALKGSFRHLLRWPWTPDMSHWREDQGIDLGSPSACVIPPPATHTSLSTGPGENQLIDLFAPPRLDFSLKPGWVLNADDYPLPAHAKG